MFWLSTGGDAELDRVGVGIVGSGLWSGFYVTASQQHRRADAVAVCNPNLASAERLAKRHGVARAVADYSELLVSEDLDAVAIVTPNDSHADLAVAALEAGKHVLCEKPMALSLAEAQRMQAAADGSGLVTGINFTWRHPAAARYARDIVASGELGRIYHLFGCFQQGWLRDHNAPRVWRLQRAKTGTGTLGDIGSHILDLAEWVTGQHIRSVVADLETFVDERPLPEGGRGPVDVDDAASVLARFDDGAMGTFTSSRYVPGQGMDQRLEIYGEKGALSMDFNDQQNLRVSIGRFAREGQMISAPIPARFGTTPERYLGQNVTNFIDAILQGEAMSPSFADGVHNQALLDAVVQSGQDRAWVDVAV